MGLECQFNRGHQIDWDSWGPKIEKIISLGFRREEAQESLAVFGGSLVEATEYLVQPAQDRLYQKTEQMKKLKKSVTFDYHHTVVQAREEAKKQREIWMRKSGTELKQELNRLHQELAKLREVRSKKEEDLQSQKHVRDLQMFKAFMGGLLASDRIGPVEVRQLDRQREQRTISDDEYRKVLKDLGTSQEDMENMKQFEETRENPDDRECVLCFESGKNVMITPCNHVCFCEECATEMKAYPKEKQLCPMCSKPAGDYIKTENLDVNLGDGPG